MDRLTDYITVNADIQFGKPVFKGTRVPVQSLSWHLEKGISLADFLQDFPGVSRKGAEAVIEWAAKYFGSAEMLSDEITDTAYLKNDFYKASANRLEAASI